jgi:hypothetical protein
MKGEAPGFTNVTSQSGGLNGAQLLKGSSGQFGGACQQQVKPLGSPM